jgi:hypothetical protein
MTAPLEQSGGSQPRALVDSGRLWTGGVAAALVAALVALAAALAAALVNLVAGGTAGVLPPRLGGAAVHNGTRRYLAAPAGRSAARLGPGFSQAGARRPRR